MAAFSDYLEQKQLDDVFNGVDFPSPATWVALHTADPTDDGSGAEVSGGSYARQQVNINGGASPTWDLAVVDGVGYLVDNTHTITFPTATAGWGTVTHVAIWDAVSAGNLLYHGALTASKTVDSGETFEFAAGDLDIKHE